MRNSRFSTLLLVVLGWMNFGCTTEPITGRWQFLAFSEGELNQMGEASYQQLLTEAKVSANVGDTSMIERVGRRIAAVTDERLRKANREPYQWEFKVIDAPETANAFALPGGKVAFYSGILPICGSEAGVAVVMGHEVGHAYAQHGNERVSRTTLAQVGLQVATAAIGQGEESTEASIAVAALGLGYSVGIDLPFSRIEESSADHIGLMLMAEAGYDPREAAAFWTRMQKMSGQGGLEFLSTHPSHETRIEQINEWIPEAMAAYENARATAIGLDELRPDADVGGI